MLKRTAFRCGAETTWRILIFPLYKKPNQTPKWREIMRHFGVYRLLGPATFNSTILPSMRTLLTLFFTAALCSSALADDRSRQDRLTDYTLELIYEIDPSLRGVQLIREELPHPAKNLAVFGTVTFRYAGDPPANQRVVSLSQDYNGLKPGEQPRLQLTLQRARIEWLDAHTERTTILESHTYMAERK